MSGDENCETLCQIDRALSVVGDRWTLLILRELSMGVRRFDDIQAQTGMSSNLLNQRLKRMEKDGVIERKAYCARPVRYEYYSTPKGRELDGVLLALRAWGMRWGGFEPGAEPAVNLVHRATGETIGPDWQVPQSDRPFSFGDVESTISQGFQEEREARLAAFKEKLRAKKARG